MFRMMIDTCVWLDVAKDQRQQPVLAVIEELVKRGMLTLLVPRIVLAEFRKNRGRIESESAKSLSSHLFVVKDAVKRATADKRKSRAILSKLDDVGQKAPILGGVAVASLDRIEKLLAAACVIETTDEIALRAGQRALQGKAPFHRGKNSMADAAIIEAYAECLQEKGTPPLRFAFVTHNHRDFSVENGSTRQPHPDIAGLFSRVRSLYFVNLAEALRRVDASLVSQAMIEHAWVQEPRGLTEILEAEDLLFHQVWYNRHWNTRIGIEEGRIKLVDVETYPRSRGGVETILRTVWTGALQSAARVERKYGRKNLGPWTDFEWGMLNGKLSALRWALGDEWDMLDT